MKSKTKRLLSLLLALSLILALCACGKSENGGNGSDTSASPEATPEFAYVSDFKKLELTGKSAAPAALTDEGFYYYYMEQVGERSVPEGQKALFRRLNGRRVLIDADIASFLRKAPAHLVCVAAAAQGAVGVNAVRLYVQIRDCFVQKYGSVLKSHG